MLAEVAGEKVGLVLAEVFSPQPRNSACSGSNFFVCITHSPPAGDRYRFNPKSGNRFKEFGLSADETDLQIHFYSTLALKPLLKGQNWQPPQVNFLLRKNHNTEGISSTLVGEISSIEQIYYFSLESIN